MEAKKVDTFQFKVMPFDDDFTGRLSWQVLGRNVLCCAQNHAAARGFDSLTVNGHRYLWVLSRMTFDIKRWPKMGEEYNISTWVRRYFRFFTDRVFELRNAQGEILGYVYTIWAMIDEITRQPQKLIESTFAPYLAPEIPIPESHSSRVRVETDEPTYSRHAYYSDIDQNNHVNSIRYIEYIMDAFPKDFFNSHEVRHLEIAYNSESYANDELSVFTESAGDNAFHVIIKKNIKSGKHADTVCRATVNFKEITI